MNNQIYQGFENRSQTAEDVLRKLKTPHSILNDSHGQNIEQDQKETQELLRILEEEYQYSETAEEIKNKESKIDQLKKIINNWIEEVAQSKGIPQDRLKDVGGGLLIFGSFRLEVNSQESDIDTVCVVPNFINREDHFFGQLAKTLSSNKDVSEIYLLDEAYIPLIKIKYCNIQFDILFSQIDQQYLGSKLDFSSNKLLQNMDEKSTTSINGFRVAEYMLKNQHDYLKFKITLKLVKLWAKNKGVYSNLMGFLGGIAWTILVAKICQLYPNYEPNRLLERFFFIYSLWRWQDMPVQIEELREDSINPRLTADQWKPEYKDKSMMMIITPCFPCQNCAHSVSSTTLKILVNNLKKADTLIQSIKKGKQQWKNLFEKAKFFKQYRHFLEINVLATNKQDFNDWKGQVESKLRKLTRLFEDHNQQKLVELNLYPFSFEINNKDPEYQFCASYYYGIKSLAQSNDKDKIIDIRFPIYQFTQILEGYSSKKVQQTMSLKIVHLARHELNQNLFEGGIKPKWTQLKSKQKQLQQQQMQTLIQQPDIIPIYNDNSKQLFISDKIDQKEIRQNEQQKYY